MLLHHHGKNVVISPPKDFRGLRSVQRPVAYYGFYPPPGRRTGRGLFSTRPSGYTPNSSTIAKMTPEQLVDRHGVANEGHRTVFVRYITTCPSLRLQTLYSLEQLLVKNFWETSGPTPDIHPQAHPGASRAAGGRIKTA